MKCATVGGLAFVVLALALLGWALSASPAQAQVTPGAFVKKAGDTMSGRLRINYSAVGPGLSFKPPASAPYAIFIERTGSAQGICIGGTSLGVCNAGITYGGGTASNGLNVSAIDLYTDARFFSAVSADAAFKATGTGYLQLAGVATGSLPSCAAGTNGSLHYDTTATCFKYCNGSAWSACLAGGGTSSVTLNGASSGDLVVGGGVTSAQSEMVWGAYNPDAAATEGTGDTNMFLIPYQSRNVATSPPKFRTIACNWRTAGTGAGVVEIAVRDLTAASDICACQLSSCTSTAVQSCSCNGTMSTTAHNYALRLTSNTTCTANPGLIGCGVTISQ